MACGRFTLKRRTRRQVLADERAEQLARYLGRALRDGRLQRRWTQRESSAESGLAQPTWSLLERGGGAGVSLRVGVRASYAVESDLRAYLDRASSTSSPRDAVHLRHQELIIRESQRGGWRGNAEVDLGGASDSPPVAGVILGRGSTISLWEVWDWFADVGAALRSFDRKVTRLAARTGTGSAPASCWVIRATRHNRRLVAQHAALFASRFRGSGIAWLKALVSADHEPPAEPALLWVTVRGDRLFAARLRTPRPSP